MELANQTRIQERKRSHNVPRMLPPAPGSRELSDTLPSVADFAALTSSRDKTPSKGFLSRLLSTRLAISWFSSCLLYRFAMSSKLSLVAPSLKIVSGLNRDWSANFLMRVPRSPATLAESGTLIPTVARALGCHLN